MSGRIRCPVCNTYTKYYIPEGGDGSTYRCRPHGPRSRRCPGARLLVPSAAAHAASRLIAKKAAEAGRDYVTPEDVQAVIDEGVERLDLASELLAILGRQRGLGIEDASLCCFIAYKFEVSA